MDDFEMKINKVNLYEMVADKLENMILNGEITGTDGKLPSEQSLAVSFGVSRPVVREAFMLLKARGLIVQKNGEGSFVCAPPVENLTQTISRMMQSRNIQPRDIFAVRKTLEEMAFTFAAARITDREICELRGINDTLRRAPDTESYIESDVRFHVAVAEASGNELLSIFVNSLTSLLIPIFRVTQNASGADISGYEYHERLISSLAAHDSKRAGECIREHIARSMCNYDSTLEKTAENGTEE
ncbi:MAG: FadR/GntR family transcriptional regulator [Eubacteriales bacterium]